MFFLDLLGLGSAASLTSEDGITGAILKAARSLFYTINTAIYEVMAYLYDLFIALCNARFLDNETFANIATRIGLILGVVMLFRVVFNFIQILLDPDKFSDKEIGAVAVIKKVLLVIVMLGISNFFFETLYQVQNFVLGEGIIYKLIMPTDDVEIDTKSFGNVLSARVFGTFYTVEEQLLVNEIDMADRCLNYKNLLLNEIALNRDFSSGLPCLNAYVDNAVVTEETEDGSSYEVEFSAFIIDYNFILQTVFGIAFVYLLFMYVIKVGVRIIQLTVLQIISPMAIVGYLSPKKDNLFTKWWKIYFATYIDIFIRVAIIYFMVFLSSILLDTYEEGSNIFWDSVNPANNFTRSIIVVVMIFALLTFAKKAPELIKELMPASASKLGFGASMKDVVGLQKGAKIGTGIIGGAAGGAAIGLIGGGIGGFAAGMLKGGFSGLKGQGLTKTASGAWKNQSKANKAYADAKANGAGWFGYNLSHLQQNLGMRTSADVYDLEKSDLEKENAAYAAFDGYMDAAEKRAEGQILKGAYAHNRHAQEAMKQKNLAEIYRQQSSNIKRSDYTSDSDYDTALSDLANKASAADSMYLREMKSAKKDYISDILNGTETDVPTMQNLQQAAGVVDANIDKNYNFVETDSRGRVIGKKTGAQLLAGNYDLFDNVNSNAKSRQAANNNRLALNKAKGASSRANAGK